MKGFSSIQMYVSHTHYTTPKWSKGLRMRGGLRGELPPSMGEVQSGKRGVEYIDPVQLMFVQQHLNLRKINNITTFPN